MSGASGGGFRFGLQKVLELREQEEQAQARALADAERRAREAEGRLALLRQIREEEAGKLMGVHSRGRAVGHLQNLSFVIHQLAERVSEAEQAVREAEERVVTERGELVTAMTQRRALDQLKDRRQEEWRLGQRDLDRKQMDELALGRFQRRDDGGNGSGS